MNDWTEEAERAVRLCERWAGVVLPDVHGQLLLFGSAIYKGGEQFDRVHSDLDIVYVFPDGTDAVERAAILKRLRKHKQQLELDMLPALQRVSCDEPGVSVVPVTALELMTNIHKSGARSFFDKNFFYDLAANKETLGIPTAGTRILRDERRQAIEFVQKVRNEYLAVSANSTGGLKAYAGSDPMPKALLRSAAQLVPNVAEGEWYDTRLGLELMSGLLSDRRTQSPDYKRLFDKISVRRGGRGVREPLSDEDQLLLAEVLFDEVAKASTDEVVTWDLQASGLRMSEENARKLFSAVTRIVPEAKLVGHWPGSIILRIRSSRRSFETMKLLSQLSVLPRVLGAESATIHLVEDGQAAATLAPGSRLDALLEVISDWRASPGLDWRQDEASLAEHLARALGRNSSLSGAQVLRDVRVHPAEYPFELDFLLSWQMPDGTVERIAIDLTRLRSSATFFHKVAQLLVLGKPLVLVAVGSAKLLDRLRDDIQRLAQLNANITVVTVVSEGDASAA